jgi:hypothetical protein
MRNYNINFKDVVQSVLRMCAFENPDTNNKQFN